MIFLRNLAIMKKRLISKRIGINQVSKNMATKLHIWIFNQYATTPDMPGGSRHYDLSKELVKKGYEVTIFASSFNYSKHAETILSKTERWKMKNVDGIQFVWLKTLSYQKNNWRRIINMLSYTVLSYCLGRKISKIIPSISKPDIIIGSTVHLFAVLSAYYIARHYQAKFLMEVRDLWPQTLIDIGELSEKSLIAKAMYALEKFLYKKAEKIITLQPLASDYIISRGISDDKIIFIPNGVDLTKFKTDHINQHTLHYFFTIFYLGAHGRVNALDTLIDAAKIVKSKGYKEIRFILVGDGTEKPRLIARKEEMNLDNVEFRNSIPKSEVSSYIELVDACIATSLDMDLYKYGISFNKVFDYLAMSKPIIIAWRPINDIVKEADCGFSVPPNEPDVLADAIIALYQMTPGQRLTMGKRGREYVEKYYDTKILADKLSKCIKEVSETV